MPTLKRFEYAGKEGPQAAALAVKHIKKSKDEIERRYAVCALGSLENEAAPYADGLVAALEDEDSGCRYHAALALNALGPAAAEHVLCLGKALKDSDPGVRFWAATALGTAGTAAASQADALQERFEDEDPHVCVAAAKALVLVEPSLAEAAATKLGGARLGRKGLHHRDDMIRGTSAKALGELGAAALPHQEMLRELLADPCASVRAAAAATLGGLGVPVVKDAADPLAKIVKEEKDPDTRQAAASALKLLDPFEALKHEDAGMRRWAASIVAESGDKAAPHAEALTGLLNDSDAFTRLSAARALGSVGEAAEPHLEVLLASLRDPEPGVRLALIKLFVKFFPDSLPEALEALVAGLSDEDPSCRARSAEGLGCAGDEAKPHTAALAVALEDEAFDVRLAAVKALHLAGRQAVRDTGTRLAVLAKDSDPEMRRTALFALRDHRLAVRFGLPREDAI